VIIIGQVNKANKFGHQNKKENAFLNQFHTNKVEEEPKPTPHEGSCDTLKFRF
jgi:hypothetical protein